MKTNTISTCAGCLIVVGLLTTGKASTPAAAELSAADRERQGEVLAAELRKPQVPLSTTGVLITRGSVGPRVRVPIKMRLLLGAGGWRSVYEATAPSPTVERLTIIHEEGQLNRYLLEHVAADGAVVDSTTLSGDAANVEKQIRGSGFAAS